MEAFENGDLKFHLINLDLNSTATTVGLELRCLDCYTRSLDPQDQ